MGTSGAQNLVQPRGVTSGNTEIKKDIFNYNVILSNLLKELSKNTEEKKKKELYCLCLSSIKPTGNADPSDL